MRSIAHLEAARAQTGAQDHKAALMGSIGAAIRQGGDGIQTELKAIVQDYGLSKVPGIRLDRAAPSHRRDARPPRLPSPPLSDDDIDEIPRQFHDQTAVSRRVAPGISPGIYTAKLHLWMQSEGKNFHYDYRPLDTLETQAHLRLDGQDFTAIRRKKLDAKHEVSRQACVHLRL